MLRVVNEYTYLDILDAYLECRKSKRNTYTALEFEMDFEIYLDELLEEINNRTYVHGPSRVFVVAYPKPREIWAAQFRDRVVHHLLCRDLIPFFDKRFIDDSYACRKNKGTLAATNRAVKFVRSVTQNGSKKAYVLKTDIANFFVSINKEILWNIFSPWLDDSSLTGWLTKLIIFYDPTKNPIIKSNINFNLIPKHKSLWYCKNNCGLPIGNLTSQFFANMYLDGLDQYVKHILKIKKYVRYVDDIIIFHQDKDTLLYYKDEISKWLVNNRDLDLHPNKTFIYDLNDYNPEFIGKIINVFYTKPRQLVIDKVNKVYKDDCFNSIQSYLGLFRHDSTYRLRKHLCSRFPCNYDYTKINMRYL